jgi:ABC-type antimicrobial peptide transport system, permease component
MKRNLKIAFRTLLKGKLYTIINILGLTLGLTSCLLIGAVVFDELSYDTHWSHSKNLYRLLSIRENSGDYSQKGGTVFATLAPTLKHQFPEVVDYSEIYPAPIHLKIDKAGPVPLKATMLHADSAVMQLLDIRLLSHQDLTPSRDIKKIVISQRFSNTHFSGTNPLGKRIYDVPQYDEPNEYVIAGVMKDLPPNTHLRADALLLHERTEQELTNGGRGAHYARHYVLLRDGTDPTEFERKINAWYRDIPENDKGLQFGLQPMEDIYLKTDFPAYQLVKGNIRHSYIFMAVAAMLLLIACINYINLSTARASSRLKTTGVHKILGASRRQIMGQSLIESLLTFSAAGLIACLCYQLVLPSLQHFIGHPLAFRFGAGWPYLTAAFLVFLLICLFSGLYPAWLVSGFRAVGSINQVLKERSTNQKGLREALVVTQFALSIGILVALFVVQHQVDFLKNKDVGFDTEGLLSLNHVSWDNKASVLKAELAQHPDILSASFSTWLPTDGAGYMTRLIDDPRDPGNKTDLWYIAGDPDMAQTLGLRLKEGRFLNGSKPGDAIEATDLDAAFNSIRPCLITASTAHMLGITQLNVPLHEAKIIPVGIIDDFNSESLHNATVPTVIVGQRNPSYGPLLIRSRPGTSQRVMRSVAATWKSLYPDKLIDMQIVRETLAKQYEAEEKLQEIFGGFSLLTMLLAALGVFGLVVHATSLRVKEIGIRKVLGASVSSIMRLLSADFVKLVLVAVVIASPIAWWAMNKWLEDFAYRIDIQWWMFAAAGLAAVVIALLTVSWQAIRAATANPVDSLRDE